MRAVRVVRAYVSSSAQGKITMTILGTENALPPQELTCPSVNVKTHFFCHTAHAHAHRTPHTLTHDTGPFITRMFVNTTG